MTSFRMIALAGMSALAFGLLSAVSVSAHAFEYDAKLTSVTAKGENHTFTAGEAIISCKKAEFKWTGTEGKHATIQVTPTYKECTVLEETATVTVEKGAKFEFLTPHELKLNEFKMLASIVGETGARLKIAATISGQSCEVFFPAQAIAGETTKFVDNGGKTGAEVRAKLEGVKYTSNNKCAGFVGAEGTNGRYEGNAAETGLIVE